MGHNEINSENLHTSEYTNILDLTPKDYALLSRDAYRKKNRITPKYCEDSLLCNMPAHIEHITHRFKTNNPLIGYSGKAHIFRNKDTNECDIIFAHKGTKGILDLDDDMAIFLKKAPNQTKSAKKFIKKTKDFCEAKGFKICKIENTGHSLGAIIAEVITVTEKHNKAFTFDSPGSKEMIKEHGQVALEEARRKIVNYNARINPINFINRKAGEVYTLNDVWTHDIASFLNHGFDKNGQPKNYSIKTKGLAFNR